MKIKNLNELQDKIDEEMQWRKRELGNIQTNIKEAIGFTKETAIRAGIALLYAHWEGCIKNIATYYLAYVSELSLSYDKLTPNFLAVVIKHCLIEFKESRKATIHTRIVNQVINRRTIKDKIPVDRVIYTEGNLNSELFKEIMATIGLPCDRYECDFKLIDRVLLKNRNIVAHGERVETLSIDEDRYCDIHEKIVFLLDTFSKQVLEAAISKLYLNVSDDYGAVT